MNLAEACVNDLGVFVPEGCVFGGLAGEDAVVGEGGFEFFDCRETPGVGGFTLEGCPVR